MDEEWQKYLTDFDEKSGARLPTTASLRLKKSVIILRNGMKNYIGILTGSIPLIS